MEIGRVDWYRSRRPSGRVEVFWPDGQAGRKAAQILFFATNIHLSWSKKRPNSPFLQPVASLGTVAPGAEFYGVTHLARSNKLFSV